ncbi:MAG: hypothetical protein ACTHOK_03380 [Nocardioidaceae bacterium]
MILALLVTLIGIGASVAGMLQPDLYDIGIMVTFLGAIGVLVRLVDWVRFLRD